MGKLIGTILLLFVAVQAAYVEDIIWLCDSTHAYDEPKVLLSCPFDSTIWAGGNDVTVFNAGLTRTEAAVRPVGEVWSMCYNPANRKVCVADESDDIFRIIDAATRTQIDSFRVPANPMTLLYDDARNVVYCVSEVADTVTVICGSGDTIISQIRVGRDPLAACLDTGVSRLYVGSTGDIYAIDTRADTVAAVIPTSYVNEHAVCNPREHKAYMGSWSNVSVIDTRGDSLLFETPMDGCRALVLDPAGNKVYASAKGALVVFDCATDSVRVESLPVWWWRGQAMALDTAQHKLYCFEAEYPWCWVFDTRADTLLRVIYVGIINSVALSANGRIYLVTNEGLSLLAIDPATDELCAATHHSYDLEYLVEQPQTGRMFCLGGYSPFATAIDPAGRVVSGGAGIPPFSRCLAFVAGGTKLYSGGNWDCYGYWFVNDAATGARLRTIEYEQWCAERFLDMGGHWADRAYGLFRWAGESTTWAIDTRNDSVVDSLELGHWDKSCAAPEYDRVYFLERVSLTGVDVATNSVTLRIPLGSAGELAYSGLAGRLYVSRPDSDDVLVIDIAGDSVVDVIADIGVRPRPLAIDEVLNRLFVGCTGSEEVVVVDTRTGEIEARVPVSVGWSGLLCDPDSHRVFVSGRMLYVLDGVGLTLVDSVALPATAYSLVWNAEYQRLFAGAGDQVFVVRLGAGGIEDRRHRPVRPTQSATITKGTLRLPGRAPAWLLDITGRCVMDLAPGENDVSRIAPGVYFVVAEQDRAVSKVILQR